MDRKGILEDLVRELTSLPGIGRKTAQRLAFHILKQPREDAERLARAVLAVKERLGLCRQCRNLAEGELCDICRDPARDATRVVVVEEVLRNVRVSGPILSIGAYGSGIAVGTPQVNRF